MKKFLSGLLIGLILTTATPVIAKEISKTIKAKENIITVKYNDLSKTKQKVYIINKQTYVPLSIIGNLLNKNTSYNNKINIITISDKPAKIVAPETIELTTAQKYDKINKESLLLNDELSDLSYKISYELNKELTDIWNTLTLDEQKTYLKTKLNNLRTKYPYKNLYIYSVNDYQQSNLLDGWWGRGSNDYDFWRNHQHVN